MSFYDEITKITSHAQNLKHIEKDATILEKFYERKIKDIIRNTAIAGENSVKIDLKNINIDFNSKFDKTLLLFGSPELPQNFVPVMNRLFGVIVTTIENEKYVYKFNTNETFVKQLNLTNLPFDKFDVTLRLAGEPIPSQGVTCTPSDCIVISWGEQEINNKPYLGPPCLPTHNVENFDTIMDILQKIIN